MRRSPCSHPLCLFLPQIRDGSIRLIDSSGNANEGKGLLSCRVVNRSCPLSPMGKDSLHQLNLTLHRRDDKESSYSEGPRTTGDVMNVEICDGGSHHFSPAIVNRMMDQADIEVRRHLLSSRLGPAQQSL